METFRYGTVIDVSRPGSDGTFLGFRPHVVACHGHPQPKILLEGEAGPHNSIEPLLQLGGGSIRSRSYLVRVGLSLRPTAKRAE